MNNVTRLENRYIGTATTTRTSATSPEDAADATATAPTREENKDFYRA